MNPIRISLIKKKIFNFSFMCADLNAVSRIHLLTYQVLKQQLLWFRE